MKKETQYTLKQPFEYAKNGETIPAEFITIKCPSNKVLSSLSIIESQFMNAIQKAQKEANQEQVKEAMQNKEQEEELDGKGALMILLSYGDINVCYNEFKPILNKTAFVDGDIPFVSGSMWDKLSIQDTKCLLGEYIANFIMPSLPI